MEPILAALNQLDPLNDAHWTENGDPLISAVKEIAGPDVEVTRQLIINAAPALTRKTSGQPESGIAPVVEAQVQDPFLTDNGGGDDDFVLVAQEGDDDFDAVSFLLGKYDGVTNELLYKTLSAGESLNDQELHLVLGAISSDDMALFAPLLLEMQTGMQRIVDRALSEVKNYRRMEAIVKNHLAVLKPEQSNQDAIRAYLEAQNKNRLDLANQRSIVLKNIDVRALSPLSALDTAMSRKTARGTQRPKY